MEATMRVWLKRTILTLVVLFVAIQFVRPPRTNPPINPNLEISAVHPLAPEVESIFTRSCNDCHSNRTVWPWYSGVAPSSWLVAGDVNEGRSKMNLRMGNVSGEETIRLAQRHVRRSLARQNAGERLSSDASCCAADARRRQRTVPVDKDAGAAIVRAK